MRDMIILGALILFFATAVTTHVAIVAGLVARRKPGSAALSFFLPPLAPAWALREGMTVRGAVWLVAVVGYGAAWLFAR